MLSVDDDLTFTGTFLKKQETEEGGLYPRRSGRSEKRTRPANANCQVAQRDKPRLSFER